MRCRLLRALFSPLFFVSHHVLSLTISDNFSILYFSPEPHLDLKSSISKERRGSLPQLRVNSNSQEPIIDMLLLWVHRENFYICSTWLMWWKTAEAHLKCRFFYFPRPLSLREFQASVWLEDLVTDYCGWGFGQSQHSCFDNMVKADKVMWCLRD